MIEERIRNEFTNYMNNQYKEPKRIILSIDDYRLLLYELRDRLPLINYEDTLHYRGMRVIRSSDLERNEIFFS